MVQGYYVSRPLPADEFITWLTDRNGRVDISAGNVIYPRFGT